MKAGFDKQEFLRTLTHRPGVYRMLDASGRTLYVGKARDLQRRVSSYFGRRAVHPKVQALMNATDDIEVTVTSTEPDALLLEATLIKRYRPRYNIVLRDDKSYPWIFASTDHAFPAFEFYRGSRRVKGRYFGPYPSAGSVRATLGQLQKIFRIRQCNDSFFSNRSRPCLQYQIHRCTAPCVGAISAEEYSRDVSNAVDFLEGRNDRVVADLADRMESAARAQDYERAATVRDQIAAVRQVQSQQSVAGPGGGNLDLLAIAGEGDFWCVSRLLVRAGQVLGSRNHFPQASGELEAPEVLSGFITQYYLDGDVPEELVTSMALPDSDLLSIYLEDRAGRPVRLASRVRSERRRLLEMALSNAREALATRLASRAGLDRQLSDLARRLGLAEAPRRIECFDVSHTGGEATVAACVVFGTEGPSKTEYRRYNIKTAEAGDDYGAMQEAVHRRYRRAVQEEAVLPDLLMVDGGPGQLAAATEVLQDLAVSGVALIGVAKGQGRKPGREKIYLPDSRHPVQLPASSAALHLIQQVRDEAHRFAITGHRQQRSRRRQTSLLEEIPGLGPKRRRELLRRLGGLQGIRRAGVEDLAQVPGISHILAQRIFQYFHGGSGPAGREQAG